MKYLLAMLAAATVVSVMFLSVPPAFAHVHGITPLLGLNCVVDNTVTGANQTNSTPAAATNGGPILGLIARDVGNAPLGFGDGGFGATTGPC